MSQMDPRIPRPQQQVQNTYYRPGALAPNAPVVRAPRPELQNDTATALGRLSQVLGRVGPEIIKDERAAIDEAEALKIAAMRSRKGLITLQPLNAALRPLVKSNAVRNTTETFVFVSLPASVSCEKTLPTNYSSTLFACRHPTTLKTHLR
jgi:hypothetical protein